MTETQQGTTQLIVGDFFFACHSCKYLQVKNPEDKQTKILTLEYIAFYQNDIKLPHLQASALSSTNQVLITFVVQKNGRKDNTITQWRTNDRVLCPVIQWAALVQCISNYPGAMPATPVSLVWVCNCISHVTSNIFKSALYNGVVAAGETKLCIHHHEVGIYFIHTDAPMAMYLKGVPVFAIMMIGQWASTAFMNYIRKQIEEFILNVSKNMLTMQHFLPCPKRNKQSKKEGL
jgi:hypothetical protein